MQGKWHKSILVLTILLGVLLSSTASGSHIDSSSHSSGPPQIYQPRQVLKQVAPMRKTPDSLPSSRNTSDATTPTQPFPIPAMANQKQQPLKPHTKLGWRFLLNEQPQKAMAAYRRALRQNPRSAKAYLGLGISLKNLGEVELAKKALGKAVDLDPRLPSALVHLGYLYAEGHDGAPDLSTARRLFREASQLGDPFAAIALLDLQSGSKL